MSGNTHSQDDSTKVEEKTEKVEEFMVKNDIGSILSIEEDGLVVSLENMNHAREVCETVLDEPDFAEKIFSDEGSTANVIHTLEENMMKLEKEKINRTDTLYYDSESIEEGYAVLSTDYATEKVSEEDVDFEFENLYLIDGGYTEIPHYDFRKMRSLGWF